MTRPRSMVFFAALLLLVACKRDQPAQQPQQPGSSAQQTPQQPLQATGCGIVVHGLVKASAMQLDGTVAERFLGSGSVLGE